MSGFYEINEQRRGPAHHGAPEPSSPLVKIFSNNHPDWLAKAVNEFLADPTTRTMAVSPAMPGSDGDAGENVWQMLTVTVIYQVIDPNGSNASQTPIATVDDEHYDDQDFGPFEGES